MEKPNFYIETVKENKTEGTYILSPLPRGMGNTMGNVLRRVMLASLPGAAITHVKIKGVTHAFSTVKGLKEDTLMFLLNLKAVRFMFDADGPQKLSLKIKGAKKITAKDISDSSLCKVINSDLYLGELASDGSLDVELTVNKGIGYEAAEDKEAEYGVLAIDSIYSPVLNVSVKVEGTRVGRKTNFDKLNLEIKTDGSLTGSQALKEASKYLVEFFNSFLSGGVLRKETEQEERQAKKKQDNEEDHDSMMVDELDLPTRVINALIKHGIETVKQLNQMKDEDFNEIRGLGKKSIEELKEKLKEMQLN